MSTTLQHDKLEVISDITCFLHICITCAALIRLATALHTHTHLKQGVKSELCWFGESFVRNTVLVGRSVKPCDLWRSSEIIINSADKWCCLTWIRAKDIITQPISTLTRLQIEEKKKKKERSGWQAPAHFILLNSEETKQMSVVQCFHHVFIISLRLYAFQPDSLWLWQGWWAASCNRTTHTEQQQTWAMVSL